MGTQQELIIYLLLCCLCSGHDHLRRLCAPGGRSEPRDASLPAPLQYVLHPDCRRAHTQAHLQGTRPYPTHPSLPLELLPPFSSRTTAVLDLSPFRSRSSVAFWLTFRKTFEALPKLSSEPGKNFLPPHPPLPQGRNATRQLGRKPDTSRAGAECPPPPSRVLKCCASRFHRSVEIYTRMYTDLLPTPAKSHYVFNLRDLSKCVQGAFTAAAPTAWGSRGSHRSGKLTS